MKSLVLFVSIATLCTGCTYAEAKPALSPPVPHVAAQLVRQAGVHAGAHEPLAYLADYIDGMVAIFGRAGNQVGQIFLTGPQAVDVDEDGTLYVISLDAIYAYPYGQTTPSMEWRSQENPGRLTLCPNGNIYVSNSGTGDVTIFGTRAQNPIGRLRDPGTTDLEWITCDKRGDVFVVAKLGTDGARTDVFVRGKQSGLRDSGIVVGRFGGIDPYSPHNEPAHVLVGDNATSTIGEWDCSQFPCKATGNSIPFNYTSSLYAIAVTRDSKSVMAVEGDYSQGVSYSFPSGQALFTYYVYSYSSLALIADAAYSPGRYRP